MDMRWDVRADPSCCAEDPRVLLEMHVRTSFSRTCLFRKVRHAAYLDTIDVGFA